MLIFVAACLFLDLKKMGVIRALGCLFFIVACLFFGLRIMVSKKASALIFLSLRAYLLVDVNGNPVYRPCMARK